MLSLTPCGNGSRNWWPRWTPTRRSKILVVQGSTPDAFSAGADMGEYRERAGDAGWPRASRKCVSEALAALREMSKPSMSVIRGACFGGGLAIALATDFRLADTTAYFSASPARMGVVYPFLGTVDLVRTVGAAAAKHLLYTGEVFGSEKAARIGLIDRPIQPDQLDEMVEDLCGRILSGAHFSVRATKKIIRLIEDGLTKENEEATRLALQALESEDHREGVAAFLERRPPRFDNR